MNLEKLSNLHDRIEKKGWCKNCELISDVPLLFLPNRPVKIMVVTQGPEVNKRGREADVRRHVLSPANIFMYPFLYTLFNGKFRPDGELETEPSTAYWTHMRKCPIKGRKRRERQILNRCSGEYLWKEIEIINPMLIMAIGRSAIDFLAKGDDRLKKDLKSAGFKQAFWHQKTRFYKFKGSSLFDSHAEDSELDELRRVEADLAIIPYPSGRNARLWNELSDDYISTRCILDKLREAIATMIGEK